MQDIMIVRFSRRKLIKVLIVLALCSLSAAWASYKMISLGVYVEPNGGKFVELGKVIARLTDHKWPFAAWLFLSCAILLIVLTFVFLGVFIKRPMIMRLGEETLDVQQGWRRSSIRLSMINAVNLIEKNSQPYLELDIKNRKPLALHLRLADQEPSEVHSMVFKRVNSQA